MKNKKIKWAWILIAFSLLIVLVAAVSVPLQSRADFGNFAGDSDYGDSGGGYSSGGDYGSDGSYSSDSDSGFAIFLLWLFNMLPWPARIVLILVLTGAYFISKLFKSKGGGRNRGGRTSRPPASVYTPVQAPAEQLIPIRDYSKIDSGFDVADFTQKLSNLYVQMQNCWTARDLEPLRPYFTDSQYAQYERQVAELIRNRETSHIDRIAVLSVDILGFYQTDDSDHIKARLSTRITAYTVSDDTGEVVRGNKNAEKFMTYEWDLVRPKGQTTTKDEEVQAIACPNCGAPLNINASAKCQYCGAVVTVDKHDFVIYAIKGISQRTGN